MRNLRITFKINASGNIMFENEKKRRKYGNKRYFYINLHLEDRLDKEFTACRGELMPQEALTPFTFSDAHRHFYGQA